MKCFAAILPLLALQFGCSDGADTAEVEDTAPIDTGWPEVDVQVQQMTFELAETGIELSLVADGWATKVLFNAYNTGVGNPQVNGWDEEHVPVTSAQTTKDDPEGVTDSRSLSLEHVDSIMYFRTNESTLFNNVDNGNVTFALRLYGDNEVLSQCLVWGHSPGSLYAGNYSKVNITSAPEEFNSSQCELWTPPEEAQ